MPDEVCQVLARVTGNAYRLLGIPGNASLDDIIAAERRMRHTAAVGIAAKTGLDLPWLGPIRRTEASIREARDRLLGDPDRRLRERLFWLTTEGHSLNQLSSDALLDRIDEMSGSSAPESSHDAALLAFAEVALADPSVKNGDGWLKALNAWNHAVEDDGYWLTQMDIELDGQFEPDAVEHIETVRYETLALVADGLAKHIREAVRGGTKLGTAQRGLKVLRSFRPLARMVQSLEEDLLEPLEGDLADLCKNVEARFDAGIRYDEASMQSNALVCESATESFRKEVQPALKTLLALASKDGEVQFRTRGMASACFRKIAVGFTWADRPGVAKTLLQKAKALAPTGSPESFQLEGTLENLDTHLSQIAVQDACSLFIEVRAECGDEIVRDDYHITQNERVCQRARARLGREVRPTLRKVLEHPGLDPEAAQGARTIAALCLHGIALDHTWAERFQDAEKLLDEARSTAPPGSEAHARILEALPSVRRNAATQRVCGGMSSASPNAPQETQGADWEKLKLIGGVAFVAVLILVGILGDDGCGGRTTSTTIRRRRPVTPARVRSTPKSPSRPVVSTPASTTRLLELQRSITSGKRQVSTLEAKVSALDSEIRPVEARITSCRNVFDAAVARQERGLPVDRTDVNQAVQAHDALIPTYNRLVRERDAAFEEYEAALKRTNSMINEYNRLVGQ